MHFIGDFSAFALICQRKETVALLYSYRFKSKNICRLFNGASLLMLFLRFCRSSSSVRKRNLNLLFS